MSHFVRKAFARVLAGGACLLPLAIPAEAQAQPRAVEAAPVSRPMTSKELHQHLARGSGWIRIFQGDEVQNGTGWILDQKRRLMITNNHVVEGADEVTVTFPIWKDGKLVTAESGYRNAPKVKATVIDRDANRDLALLQVESIPDGMHELKLAAAEPDEGDDVRTIGAYTSGGDGLVWGAVSGVVRASGPQELDPDRRRRAVPVREVLSDARTNGGNSGAPVVNTAGEVVAVHFGRKPWANGVARHVSVVELKAYLKESLPLVEPKTAEQCLARATRRLAAGRVDKAIADATAALNEDPKLVAALVVRARGFVAKKDLQSAIEDFDAALKLAPGNYDVRIARGRAYRAAGKNAEAIADFSAAVRTDPARSTAYNERGLTHYLAGKFADAEADFGRAVAASPKDPVLWSNRAEARGKQKKFADAAADWAKAAELDPEDAHIANELGFALQMLGKFDAAAEAYARAVDISDGTSPLYWGNLAEALRLGGRFEGAVKGFTKALEARKALEVRGAKASPTDAAADYAGRAAARVALKQYREAVDDLTKAIELTERKAGVLFARRADVLDALGEKNAAAADREAAAKLGFKVEKPADPLVGTWVGTYASNGGKVTEEVTFRAEGTFEAVAVMTGPRGTERASETGTWSATKTALTLDRKRLGTVTRAIERTETGLKVEIKELGIVATFVKKK